MKLLLEPKLEKVFLPDAYEYRPNKSAHQAIAITRTRCWESNWVLEFDIKGLFDNIPWELLQRAVRKHVDSKWILLYIKRWLKAPLQLADGALKERVKGTPQGGCVSPTLNNLFMHYCFDYWIAREYPYHSWCRYADDGLIHCKTEMQANYILDKLRKRFTECGIELHEGKTKIIYCRDQLRRETTTNYEFDFLGFNFRTRVARNSKDGRMFKTFSPAPSPKALKEIRRVIKYRWRLQSWIHYSLEDIAKMINPVIQGWINYYAKFNKSHFAPIAKYLNDLWYFFNIPYYCPLLLDLKESLKPRPE